MNNKESCRGLIAIIAIGFWIILAPVAHAADPSPLVPEMARKAEVSVWQSGIGSRTTFKTFEDGFLHGATIAAGDVNGDGKDEIIVGSGPARKNEVRIYSLDGALLKSFRPFNDTFQGGVRVAVGELTGDKKAEIVVAPGPGMEPRVMMFSGDGKKLSEGLAYEADVRSGVHVSIGDLDRDGKREIVVAPGPGSGPHIRLLNNRMESRNMDFFAYDAEMQDGVTITILKTAWGDQLVTGVETWSSPLVRRFSFDQNGARLDKEFYAFEESSHAGISVAAYDLDGDGIDEILVSQNGGTAPEVRMFDVYGSLYKKYLLHDPTYRGALSLAPVRLNASGKPELVSVSLAPPVIRLAHAPKYILVDISEQRLTAYENGNEVKSFLVSTGVVTHPTQIAMTYVQEKIPVKRYKWVYGPGHPDNYNLPNVKWNLRIYDLEYIHGAYWHHNFGYRMSHGCVNVDYPDAEWIYNWADVGTLVNIQE
jgi:hypothetical protein